MEKTGPEPEFRHLLWVCILCSALAVCFATPSLSQQASEQLIADRFLVSVTWKDHAGRTGSGFPVLLGERSRSAVFAFFDSDNWELLVKVLDGCQINGHHWVFASASTDVEYTLKIEDLQSGEEATYSNPIGRAAPAITDTVALGDCSSGNSDPFRLQRVRVDSELDSFLKRGLEQTYGNFNPYLYGPFFGDTPSGPFGGGAGGAEGAQLSQTNVQEEGVDEEDRVKSDGDYLYILKNHQSNRDDPGTGSPGAGSGNQIRVVDLDVAAPAAREVSEFEIATAPDQIARGLYLRPEADQLIVTSSTRSLDWFYWYSPLAWVDGKSTVVSIDVTDPSQPAQETTLEMDGEILTSRRIDQVLYLATRFQPRLDGLDFFTPEGPGSTQALARIDQAELSELLPSYRSSGSGSSGESGESRPLVKATDCYLPTESAPATTADVISLVAIDLDTMELVSSKCFVGATETLYVSLDSIYVASTRYGYTILANGFGAPFIEYEEADVETDLHKFSLINGAIVYKASGSVDGHLGWNIDRKPFRLSERGDDLRVISYTGELTEDTSPVAVTVLRDTGDDALQVLSRIPNQQRPEPIGKPGEELYATRFVGDRAYLVTFLITDPLYVVDFSEPADPFLAGELEITGYSDYLHPIEGGYLVGVGKDAIPDPSGDFRGAWYQGIKVALYDVSDPANPFEADSVVIGRRGSETPVLHNHRAFTYLPEGEGRQARIAFGSRVHERSAEVDERPWAHYGWSYSGLQMFEVDTEAGKLLDQGPMIVERYGDNGASPLLGDDRSVLANDSIFYVHGDDVYTGVWGEPQQHEGPN